jgi:predicted signal transduction protein with EAL and GGDEF domain
MNDVTRPALKVLDVLALPFNIKGLYLEITASIGIAAYPVDGDSAADLIMRADQALYEAKRAGRNRFHLANATATVTATSRRAAQSIPSTLHAPTLISMTQM